MIAELPLLRLLLVFALAAAPASALAQASDLEAPQPDKVQPLPDFQFEPDPVVVTEDLLPPVPPEEPVAVVELPASDTMPEAIQKLIATASAEGDEATVAKIVALTKRAFPTRPAAIKLAAIAHDARVAAQKKAEEEARIERLRNRYVFANWKGEVELGASKATGNTHNLAIYVSGKAEREGLNWRHTFRLRGDVQETDRLTTTERLSAQWQPNYKVDDRFYIYGLTQYEHDRFLGFDSRYTMGGGIGYGVVRTNNMILDFEGGPAVRRTKYIEEPSDDSIAGRASMKFKWTLSPNLVLSQDAAVFLEDSNNNAIATTALDTRLIGALKARFSFNVQYERDAPNDREPLDTLSRATLVYSF
jgi:putative salt-induced outer membrane protein